MMNSDVMVLFDPILGKTGGSAVKRLMSSCCRVSGKNKCLHQSDKVKVQCGVHSVDVCRRVHNCNYTKYYCFVLGSRINPFRNSTSCSILLQERKRLNLPVCKHAVFEVVLAILTKRSQQLLQSFLFHIFFSFPAIIRMLSCI